MNRLIRQYSELDESFGTYALLVLSMLAQSAPEVVMFLMDRVDEKFSGDDETDYPNAHPSPLHTRHAARVVNQSSVTPRPTMPAEDAIWLNDRPFCAVCNEPLAPASEYRPPSIPRCPCCVGGAA